MSVHGSRGRGARRWIGAAAMVCVCGCGPARDPVVVVGAHAEATAPAPKGACSSAGYCWENPVSIAAPLSAVWASGPNDVYVAGYGGRILHFDGAAWKTQHSGGEAWLNGAWGSGPDDVFVVGDNGARLHRTGGTWQEDNTSAAVTFNAVWGTGPKDVFAVGDRGAIYHFDGQSWTEEDSGTEATLGAVWGSGPHDVYAVGSRGYRKGGAVVHYDGASWSEQTVGESLCGVWGTGPEKVWLAGMDSQNKVAMWSLSSGEWRPVRVPRSGDAMALTGVGGKPVLLGKIGLENTNLIGFQTDLFFVLEESGGLFQRRDLLTVSTPIGQPGWAFWGGSQDSAWVAGWWGVVGRVDATGFSPISGNAALGKNLQGVWGTSPTDVIAVGAASTILHFDGTDWRPEKAPRSHEYTALHGSNGVFVAASRGGGLSVRRKGQWKELDSGTPEDLWDVWTTGDEIFASGAHGTMIRCEAEKCAPMTTGVKETLWNVWGKSPTEVYAIGEKTTLLRWDGASWKLHTVPAGMPLSAIGSDGQGGVLAMTWGETFRLDGGAWTSVAEHGGHVMTDGDGEIRAVYGGGGAPVGIRRWDGKKWVEEAVPNNEYEENAGMLEGIWAGGGHVFVVGQGGAILHKRP